MMLGVLNNGYRFGHRYGAGIGDIPNPYPPPGAPSARWAGQLPDLEYTLQNDLAQTEASIRNLAYDEGGGAVDFATLDLDAIVQNFRNDAANFCQMMQGDAVTFGGQIDPNCQSNTGMIEKYAQMLSQFLYAIKSYQASSGQALVPCSGSPAASAYQAFCKGGGGTGPMLYSTNQVLQQVTGQSAPSVYAAPPVNALNTNAPQSGQMLLAPPRNILTASAPTGAAPVTASNLVQNVGPGQALTQGAGADVAEQTGATSAAPASNTWIYLAAGAALLFLMMGGSKS